MPNGEDSNKKRYCSLISRSSRWCGVMGFTPKHRTWASKISSIRMILIRKSLTSSFSLTAKIVKTKVYDPGRTRHHCSPEFKIVSTVNNTFNPTRKPRWKLYKQCNNTALTMFNRRRLCFSLYPQQSGRAEDGRSNCHFEVWKYFPLEFLSTSNLILIVFFSKWRRAMFVWKATMPAATQAR